MAIDPSGFSITIYDRDRRAVVAVSGELDLATSPDLEKAVLERLDAGQDVVVDLRDLQFMDSSGLAVLVTAHARAADGGPDFAIVRPREGTEVAKILDIAGIEQQLHVVEEP